MFVEGYKAHLIQHNELCTFHPCQEGVNRSLAVFLQKRVRQGGSGKETHTVTLLAGVHGNRCGKMSLSGPRGTHENEIFPGSYELQIGHIC